MKRLIGVKMDDGQARTDGILRARNRLDGCLAFELPREQMEAFCVRHNIRKLSLFGSVLTPRFRPSSDIDVLVEFEPRKDGVHVRVTFDTETVHPIEQQRGGWQAILDSFARHVETRQAA